jgi:flagellar basal-body rod modification protein FlgD
MSTLITPRPSDSSSQPSARQNSTGQFNALNEQAFMTLLTTQLQHQDPTNPVNEQQLAAEMAQFSTATGIGTLNDNVGQLVATQKAGALAKAAGLIGQQVATPGDALITDSQGTANGAFKLADSATDVRVNVLDGAGKTVDRIDIGALGPGSHTFAWKDGSPSQAYQFSVSALGADDKAVDAATLSLYRVNGVQSTAGGLALSLANNPSPLPINTVEQVF